METIIRTKHNKENPYALINKQVLEDDRLSWKAKGVLCYLLSRPDNWKTYISQLIKVSTDKETATRAAINELIKAGYIKRIRKTNPKGVVLSWQYVISELPDLENPHLENPHLENPHLENPHLENPHLENQALINNEFNITEFSNHQHQQSDDADFSDLQSQAIAAKAANLAKKQIAKAVVAESRRNFIQDSPWGVLAEEMKKDPQETFNAFKSHLEACGKSRGKDDPVAWGAKIASDIWNSPGSELNNPLWLEFAAAYRNGKTPQATEKTEPTPELPELPEPSPEAKKKLRGATWK